jgi:hypothetical protein
MSSLIYIIGSESLAMGDAVEEDAPALAIATKTALDSEGIGAVEYRGQ